MLIHHVTGPLLVLGYAAWTTLRRLRASTEVESAGGNLGRDPRPETAEAAKDDDAGSSAELYHLTLR